MAIVGISKFETQEYISKLDTAKTKEKGATVFTLGSLDVDIRAKLSDEQISHEGGTDGGVRIINKKARNNLEAVRFGLTAWSNLKDGQGNQIALKRIQHVINGKMLEVVSDESLAHLDGKLINELGQKILELNSVTSSLLGN